MHVRFRVPAKLILFGEHAVLHGAAAIAAAISLHANGAAQIEERLEQGKPGTFEVTDGEISYLVPPEVHGLPLGTETSLKMDFKLCSGLGSSAAASVGMAVVGLCAKPGSKFAQLEKGEMRRLVGCKAFELERKACPAVSGVDHTAAIEGGIIRYRVSQGVALVDALETNLFKKYRLVLWDSGIRKNTADAIARTCGVENKQEILEKIRALSDQAYEELRSEDLSIEAVHRLMRANHELLKELGVCPREMDDEVREMRKLGAEAKLSGSGNGGYLYSIVPPSFKLRPGWIECEIDRHGLQIL